MSNVAVESSSVGSDQDLPITIAAKPITTRDRNIALATIVVLAILDAIVIPFAGVQLPRVDPFIPVLQTVMCVVDLLTATLLFAQYSIQPLRAIIPVASGLENADEGRHHTATWRQSEKIRVNSASASVKPPSLRPGSRAHDLSAAPHLRNFSGDANGLCALTAVGPTIRNSEGVIDC